MACELRTTSQPIAGEIGAVNDEHAHGSAARGFFIFVGPAAVVGEGFALEELLIVRRRLVDDDQGDLCPLTSMPA